MDRRGVLSEASRLIPGDRQKQHGSAELTYTAVARMWSPYLDAHGYPIKSLDALAVLQMLALMKIARSAKKPDNADNYVDCAGYSGLAGEIATGGDRGADCQVDQGHSLQRCCLAEDDPVDPCISHGEGTGCCSRVTEATGTEG